MSSPHSMLLRRHASILSVAAFLAVGTACAQVSPSHSGDEAVATASESSSSAAGVPGSEALTGGAEALPAAPGASAAGQNGGYGEHGGGYHSHSLWSHLTYEAGGGFNGPTGDSSNDITWGGNFTVGAGYRFNPRVAAMIEYQFIDDKLPGAMIAETGANGGNAHIWSFGVEPVVNLFPKSHNDIYITGGGGFYRKVTNFTDPEPTEYCDYFYCGIGYANAVVGHFSSNQGGWNIGGGYQHKFGGMYGDSKMSLFAEVRYLDVLTPSVTTSPNGLGTTSVGEGTKLIPVTFGVRF